MNDNKSSSEYKAVTLLRDCDAVLIPQGTPISLQEGIAVTITQSLGDSFTVHVYGNLARIDGKDADALGKTPGSAVSEAASEGSIEERVKAQLGQVYDPEIPVDIVELGLVYGCEVTLLSKEQYKVDIKMTLTAPGCGMGPVITEDAKQKVLALPDVSEVSVELVFEPPWSQDMMSMAARLQLGML